jgi:membrane-associated protease RseP (regulator of RpoE activity)
VTFLYYAVGVLVIAVGIGASIALHEIGHLVPAKKFGVKVTQYMVGFGPTVWSRRKGETEYGVKWIPLGGYIRMIGMFPPKPGEDADEALRATSTGRVGMMLDQAVRARSKRRPGLAEQARQQSMDEIQPGDENRVFYKLPVPQKIIVMLGGPTMNLLIGVVLLAAVMMLYGTAVAKPGAEVASVSQCVVKAEQVTADTVCSASDPRTPASVAGLRPGDKLISVAGTPIQSTAQVGELIRPRVGQSTPIVVDRDGERLTLLATPIENSVAKLDANGDQVIGPDGKPQTVQAGFLGITSSPPYAIERQPLSAVPAQVGTALTSTAGVVLRIPQKMVGVAQAAFGSGERDLNGPISIVGVGRIAGEITNQEARGDGGWAAAIAFDLGLVASVNFALFVFNLIPLLPLDGGHVAGAMWEGVRRTVARIRNRPDPGPTDVARLLPIAYAVSSVLIVMSALLIYADVVKPIHLSG